MCHRLNHLSTKSERSEETIIVQQHFLNYCYWVNPNAVKLYKISNMILFVDSNSLYLTAPTFKICTRGFFYLGNKDQSIVNGLIWYLTKITKNIKVPAAEAEIA